MQQIFLQFLITLLLAQPLLVTAQTDPTIPTRLTLSICGNLIVDDGEECDVPGETGVYSQTIAGRQCTPTCNFGPYCGDGILQTQFGEECDDGNNDNGDFCSAICQIEPAGSGGGGSSGGGGRSGGSDRELGDTVLNVSGIAYPGQRIQFLIDTENVGTVSADGDGEFEFATDVSPGTLTLGIWANDSNNVRSITLNNTFDVTQGAVTNIDGIILPPSIAVSSQNVDPGAVVTVSGQAIPDATIEIEVDNRLFGTAQSAGNGRWSFQLNTSQLSVAQHTIRARSVTGNPPLTTRSNYSSVLQLFVGVEGSASTPSDLNRDGSVNLIDFSILIFWWQTSGGDSDPPADINGNGRVSLEDFSILLFNWTG